MTKSKGSPVTRPGMEELTPSELTAIREKYDDVSKNKRMTASNLPALG